MKQSTVKNAISSIPGGTRRLPIVFAALVLSACSFHASGSAKTGGEASGSGRSEAKASSKSKSSGSSSASLKLEGSKSGKGSASGSGSSSAKASGKASASVGGSAKAGSKKSASAKKKGSSSFKTSASTKVVFKSKKRVTSLKRSKKKSSFSATALVHGGASAKASGSASGKAGGSAQTGGSKSNTSRTTPKSGSAQSSSTARKNDSGSAQVNNKKRGNNSGSAQVDNKKRNTPTKTPPVVEEPVKVIEPPAEPPENVFGYDEPVNGCFEGIVYPIAEKSKALPTDWDKREGVSVVYACEWDIPTREWSLGFPGVAERFEWFAIRYTGAFSVEQAGEWTFKLASDDGTKLYIDGKLVVNNDGVHAPKTVKSKVKLSAGDHEMVLEYFQGPRYHINLQLYATPPGGEEGIFSVR